LTFGGLLLLGGRVADYWGRKRTFLVGLVGFAAASAVGGFAPNGATLFTARAFQGSFAALLAPSALALLSVAFVQPKERAKAFGVYGAVIGGGAAVGLILGGVLTEYLTWRWCLWVNIPIAIVAGIASIWGLRESRAHGHTSYDLGGAILITVGLAGLVYGFTTAADPVYGWTNVYTLVIIIVSLLFIASFVVVELVIADKPLLPMRILGNLTRGGAYLASLLAGAGFVGMALFMIVYFQQVLGYSPITAGLAALPVTGAIFAAYPVATTLLTRWGARPVMATGAFLSAAGLMLLTRIGVTAAFLTTVLPGELVLGVGLGMIFVPLGNVALTGVHQRDAGITSAVVNASQQIGASLGVAAMSSVALQAGTAYFASHYTGPSMLTTTFINEVKVHSFQVALYYAAGFLAVAGIVILAMVRAGRITKSADPTVHIG
jgi:EmrB/QacA subfamily drug resistance transporter